MIRLRRRLYVETVIKKNLRLDEVCGKIKLLCHCEKPSTGGDEAIFLGDFQGESWEK